MEGLGDLEVRDVDLDLLGDLVRLALDGQGAAHLLEDAALGDADRLADEDHGNVDDHLLVHADLEEVGVQHVAIDRIALVSLEEDGPLLAALDLEVDDGVELVRGGDRNHDRFRIERDVERRSERSVAHGRHQTLCP